jgi:hypothetical protein
MPAKHDPFLVHKNQLTRTPDDPEDAHQLQTYWSLVTSYAWAIFRQAGVCDAACDCGATFLHAFTPPYVNLVLPACDNVFGDTQARLFRHLADLLSTMKATKNVHEQLQCLASLQPFTQWQSKN